MFHITFSRTQKGGGNFQKEDQTRMKLWYRCKEVLISKVFDSTNRENIENTRITSIVDTKKLYVSKYFIERSQRQHKKSSRSRKSDLTNSGNLIELLQHRVEGGTKTLKTRFRVPHDTLFQFRFFFFSKGNCDIN